MKTVNRVQAAAMLTGYKGSNFFTVTFVKRTDGSVRTMNCRKGVSKFTKGGTLAYSPAEKGLLGVYDMKSADPEKGYRMINLETVTGFKLDGQEYAVK